jgi:hypothetical protein
LTKTADCGRLVAEIGASGEEQESGERSVAINLKTWAAQRQEKQKNSRNEARMLLIIKDLPKTE